MRHLVRIAKTLALAGALTGCVSTGIGGGLTVLENRAEVRGCQIAGDVEAEDARYDEVMASIRVQANRVGATHVLRVMEGTVPCGGTVCAMFAGVAYRCSGR